jgi:copper homeostasis protein
MKIELCAASIKALEIAKSFNFDRVELCQNLENGGLTPSYALIEKSLELGLQTHVLIRPRIGSFVYSNDEVDLILKDVAKCAEIGAHGVVVGAINSVNEIDESFLKRLKSLDLNL